jgi:toxin ParE1/3/4
MTAKVRRCERAFKDLDELAKYIQRDDPSAAIRFLEAAEATFQRLAEMPELGQRQLFAKKELADLRVWQVQGFKNYLIFYRPIERGIEVIRVLHAARDIDALFAEST